MSGIVKNLKAAIVAYRNTSVGALMDKFMGPAPLAGYPQNEYVGNKVAMPLADAGAAIAQQVWKTPVQIDMSLMETPALPANGPVYKFGNTGLTSGAFWSQDTYSVRNGVFTNGPAETMSWEPWTGTTATVENCSILNAGAPGKWHLNFKQQNWWPVIRGNIFGDYTDKGGSFCKAVDDGGDPSLRYSGNSRILFTGNRLKWLGANIGGTGFYGSAVANILRDNAMEGSGLAVQFGAPSTFATIDYLYNEMPFSGATVIRLGDSVAAPNNTISLVGLRNVFSNVHGWGNNRLVDMGNNQVVVNDLTLDRVMVSGLPAAPAPLVALNDLPGQKIRVGHVHAEDAPIVPMLGNHVAVIDQVGATIRTMNGDMVYADNPSTNFAANASVAVARNWWTKSSQPGVFTRSNSGANRRALRQSRFLGAWNFAAGGLNAIVFQMRRANLYEGEAITVQFLTNSSVPLSNTVNLVVYDSDGTRTTMRSAQVSSDAAWREHTLTFYLDTVAKGDDSLLSLEVQNVTQQATTFYMTGVRYTRGSFGLSGRADLLDYDVVAADVVKAGWIAP